MDPYRELGISYDATDDEIKKAYRKLSRKYHPDANINNPNKEEAEEKFKRVQEAYDMLIKSRNAKNFDYTRSSNRYQSYNNSNPEFANVVNLIRSGEFKNAFDILSNMDDMSKDGTWYYLASICELGMGNLVMARSYINIAVSMQPNNFQFRQLQKQMENGFFSRQFSNGGNPFAHTTFYGRKPSSFGWCIDLFLLNLFCRFCF